MDSFGVRLRYARKRAGLTQEELADRAGLTRQAIAMLETGKSLSTPRIMEISRVLEVSPGWLLWGSSKMDQVTPEVLQSAIDLQSLPEGTRQAILALIASSKQNNTTD